jgi:hypothetical protein
VHNDLGGEFKKLWDSKDPNRRGRLFEELFCRLLFKSGFTVRHDPAAAKPRQTDVLAEYGGDTFLFEIKWLGRKLDIEAIGQIKDRLGRISRNTIGCICSVSGFSETLIQDVENYRSQHEILLFNPREIYGVFAERLNIVDLIERKRRALRHDGAVWFFEQDGQDSKSRYVELPPSHESFELSDFSIPMRLESAHISDLLFVRTPLIFNEYLWAFSLRIRLRASSIEDLRELFFTAENHLGLQGTGTFGIRQQASGWYGLGSDNFLREIARYPERYKGYKDRIHHSEELAFFDELRAGGIFLLTARQSQTQKGCIHSGEVIVRLPGVPTNMEPYNRFIRSVSTDNGLFGPEQPLRRTHTRLLPTIRIELQDVITMVGSKEYKPDCISGVVVKNPFYRNPTRLSELLKEEQLSAFSEPEYLVCRLDDWLDAGDEVDYYDLTGLEAVTLGEAVLLHPRCTWGNLTKRAHPIGRGDGFRKIESEWKERERMEERIKRASKRKKHVK